MSNWARVIVSWTGIDHLSCDKKGADRFVAELIRNADENPIIGIQLILIGMGYANDFARYGADCCEVTALFDCNNFRPEPLQDFLRTRKWQYPRDVQLLWKTECHDQFQSWRLDDKV